MVPIDYTIYLKLLLSNHCAKMPQLRLANADQEHVVTIDGNLHEANERACIDDPDQKIKINAVREWFEVNSSIDCQNSTPYEEILSSSTITLVDINGVELKDVVGGSSARDWVEMTSYSNPWHNDLYYYKCRLKHAD